MGFVFWFFVAVAVAGAILVLCGLVLGIVVRALQGGE